jgi:multidrug efflux pump subunit AcrA (membrane-fusion protein)
MYRRRSKLQAVVIVGVLLCLAAVGYLGYELGRYSAGYSLLDVRRAERKRDTELAEREGTIDELRRQLAILETARRIDRETYAQVEQNLEQLEAQMQAQAEQLAFYQGIVSPEDGMAGLRIQSLEIEPMAGERQFVLRLVLAQAMAHSGKVAGSVELRIDGQLGADKVTFGLAELVSEADMSEITYEFRYFQTIEREVQLPLGFSAETVELEISPTEPRGAAAVVQEYSWEALSG